MPENVEVIERLYRLILSRKGGDPEKSHTAKLFARGRARIAQKVGEEAVELAIVAAQNRIDDVRLESTDLLYHLMVLWADCGITPDDVFAELVKREGTSGVDEKKSRSYPTP
jgi:phosphoribosyl-ATP pyrophosphohydrolase